MHVSGQLLGLTFERLRLLAVTLLQGVKLLLDGVQVDLHLQLRVAATRLARPGPRPQQVVYTALQLLEHLLKQPRLRERRVKGQVRSGRGSEVPGHVRLRQAGSEISGTSLRSEQVRTGQARLGRRGVSLSLRVGQHRSGR